MKPYVAFWFRRDLRLFDNHGLYRALKSGLEVVPVFIFDDNILASLKDKKDRRVNFIYQALEHLKTELAKMNKDIWILHGKPEEVWQQISNKVHLRAVYTNHDYEPYARVRDTKVREILKQKSIALYTFKDQVIFEKDEILAGTKKPYTVYAPYRKKWESELKLGDFTVYASQANLSKLCSIQFPLFPSMTDIGFDKTSEIFPVPNISSSLISGYDKKRDYPGIHGTSHLSVHLRFGTISIRQLVKIALELNETWLSELIWREFFMMILYHFPFVISKPFKEKYNSIRWLDDADNFERWCTGNTGYPIVDAGMRELNATGFMHNRVRMISASFLCKHLLIDWRWGEKYFAKKLLDFDLAANNGNWQWIAGCGCDAAPYFRIFNPQSQADKFDPDRVYIKKWVPEYGSKEYITPIIEHRFARERALKAYKKALFQLN